MTSQDEVVVESMMEEYQNNFWDMVPKPERKSVVYSKEIFMAIGFSQKEGIDYEETFAPVERYTSIRTIMELAYMMKQNLHQMDVKTFFLNCVIEEEVYIKQPQGFEVKDIGTHVCKLEKANMRRRHCVVAKARDS